MIDLDEFDAAAAPPPVLCRQLPGKLSIQRMAIIMQLHETCALARCPRSEAAIDYFDRLADSALGFTSVTWPHQGRAIGYLRSDVSGLHEPVHEAEIRALGIELGYDMSADVVIDGADRREYTAVLVDGTDPGARAVIVPSLDHLPGDQLLTVCRHYDVVAVWPERIVERLV